ncbi:MAG: hypothetical protein M4579_000849 [Chaenotheca gracillima]|nr:MAG: hypothetical protein M4579_000849 [Chaenotheca gracillima]
MSSDYAFAPPPTMAQGPPRRHPEHHGPALSTTFSAIQRFGSHLTGQTPSSATSSSSPFSGYNPATFYASPVEPSSRRSPQPTRGASASYNPQQWNASPNSPSVGPTHSHNGFSGTLARARDTAADEDGALSPPPPYSPQRPTQGQGSSSAPHNTPSPGVVPFSSPTSLQNDTPSSHTSPRLHQHNSPHLGTTQQFSPPALPPSIGRDGLSPQSRSEALINYCATASRNRSLTQTSVHDQPGRSAQVSPNNEIMSSWSHRDPGRFDLQSQSSMMNVAPQDLSSASRPPASRRAASTGAIGTASVSRSRGSTSPTRQAWEPGMPLPPPPPGPPPNARSQSMSRSSDMSHSSRSPGPRAAAPPTRRPAQGPSRLPPVPPTPADWVDEDALQSRGGQPNLGGRLYINTGLVSSRSPAGNAASAPRDTSSRENSMNRAETVQENGSKGIRERRSESRTRQQRMTEAQSAVAPTSDPWADTSDEIPVAKPADLVLPNIGSSGLSRRRTINKSTPRSARSMQHSDAPLGSANSARSSAAIDSTSTRNTTPQPDSSRTLHSPKPLAPTPPFSPGRFVQNASPSLPPKSLPTPPPQSSVSGESRFGRHSALSVRDAHQLVQSPDTDLSQSSASIRPMSAASGSSEAAELFARAAVDRHRLFAEREAAVSSDRERVQLFAEFIVSESRMRRDRYAGAIDAMGSEILDLTRDLFRPTPKSEVSSPESRDGAWSSRPGSLSSAVQESPNSLKSPTRQESSSFPAYKPSLSPILSMSMSVSEAQDELGSRGRPSSRWWETSQEGSITGGGQRRLERSKRESKYMGLPLRAWDDSPSSGSTAGPSIVPVSEYPPEKVGWHEQVTPVLRNPRKLDVSRLVTLPPPYPRHYPAVNNNHPDLTPIRNNVRSAMDLSVAGEIKDAFQAQSEETDAEAERKKIQMRKDIRRQVEDGEITYAEAARMEEAEEKREQHKVKAEFERYQEEVMTPLKTMFQERIEQASDSYEYLRTEVLHKHSSPVEEGDEKPELLEKLTLMKWLFEAREQLHREQYDLVSERSNRYKAVVIAPYSPGGRSKTPSSPVSNADKIRDVEAFFSQDHSRRRLAFEKETLSRYEAFMDITEESVKRGVEVQLSAFWDIAPSLLEVIQRVDVVRGVQMPENNTNSGTSSASGGSGAAASNGHEEFDFSQQYLWEVLCHAEKSAYQFIEGQVNLLCLLHEVKSGVAKQRCRVMEAEALIRRDGRTSASSVRGENDDVLDVDGMQREEEDRLTVDLKDKVGVVERQWEEAMGKQVAKLKEGVKAWLVENGGWDAVEQE